MESMDFIKDLVFLLLVSSSIEPVISDVMTLERSSCSLMKRLPVSFLNSSLPNLLLDSQELSHILLTLLEGD